MVGLIFDHLITNPHMIMSNLKTKLITHKLSTLYLTLGLKHVKNNLQLSKHLVMANFGGLPRGEIHETLKYKKPLCKL